MMPLGASSIQVFPIGLVNHYIRRLLSSATLRLWPNLARLLNRFIRERYPHFKFTTIQFNRNYCARMHVDGNNLGPTMNIGLGDYEGRALGNGP